MVAANLRARALAPVVRDTWAAGFMSYHAMSRKLKRRRVPTLRGGKQWYPMTAGRLLVRLERAGLIRTSEDVRNSSESGTIHPRPGLRGPFRFLGNLRGPEHLRKSFGVTIDFKRGKKSLCLPP